MKTTYLPALALVALLAAASARAQIAEEYCFGTGCPCGNDDPERGCGNSGVDSSATTGAGLVVLDGCGSVVTDDLVLHVSGMQPTQSALVYMGSTAIRVPFGDGQRCAGAGATGVFRFGVRTSDAFGEVTETGIVTRSQSFPAAGRIVGGSTWYFQAWYRDVGGPCGAQFNLTNAVAVTFPVPKSGARGARQAAGNPLGEFPGFEHVRSFNAGAEVFFDLGACVYDDLVGTTVDVYFTAPKSAAEWDAAPGLADVRGAPTTVAITGAGSYVADAGTLGGTSGAAVGVGYDMVLDVDRDGSLDLATDIVDGYGDEPGLFVVRDIAAAGPYAVTEVLYSGGSWLGQDTYYPTSIASLGQLPVIVVSHGNGHNYQWYDHVGFHMASYGYVVMSHQNNTGPGIDSASETILNNTDWFAGNYATVAGGVLAGHVDVSRITWIGHSRGGEGVTRAYDRLFDGETRPSFDIGQLRFVSSIAPTNYLGEGSSHPHGVPYHLWTGAADADVSGTASLDHRQTFHLLERATGLRLGTVYQGVGHGAFHDGGGSTVTSGPCQVDRPTTHSLMLPYFLAANRWVVDGDLAAKDFLWRQYESFHALGSPDDVANPCIISTMELKEDPASGIFVIDDYESNPALGTSSSGGPVTFDVSDALEGILDDADTTFSWTPADPMNGMTRARPGENVRGVVFAWSGPAFYELGIVAGQRDVSSREYLTFRAAQITQHPYTLAELGDLTFRVVLRDAAGTSASISIGAYGGGLEQPYARSGGWHNEFETIRIRLTDFAAGGSGLDLGNVVAVRFELGGEGESPVGYVGLDDVALTVD